MSAGSHITGTLIDSRTGYHLAGLRVVAIRGGAAAAKYTPGQAHPEKGVLGSAVSDAQGRFSIALASGVTTVNRRRRRWFAPHSTPQAYALRVERATGTPYTYFVSSKMTLADATSITMTVPLPERPVTPELWRAFGERLQRARISRMNIAIRQLISPQAGAGAFADWDVETRLGIVSALEQEYLDPTGALRAAGQPVQFRPMSMARNAVARKQIGGLAAPAPLPPEAAVAHQEMIAKISSYSDIAAVTQPIDPVAFISGNPSAGANQVESKNRSGGIAVGSGVEKNKAVNRAPNADDLINYRDYLRDIWQSLLTYLPSAPTTPANDALKARFHQDFLTTDTSAQPANELLIDIVTDILVSVGDAYHGFGVNPSSIPPRGDTSARDYLDQLIGLTGVSAQELGLRFRLDLGRPDSELSNAVQENISTLQGFYRDSFQIAPETPPFIPAYGGASWPVHIPPPFFLEYEEWLAGQRPFYPENYYQIRPKYPLGRLPDRGFTVDDYAGMFFPDLDAALTAGLAAVRSQEYGEAAKQYGIAATTAAKILVDAAASGRTMSATIAPTPPGGFGAEDPKDRWYPKPSEMKISNLNDDLVSVFQARRGLRVAASSDLDVLINWLDLSNVGSIQYNGDNHPYLYQQCVMAHTLACVFPVLFGDLALAQGNYREAVQHYLRTLDRSVVVGLADPDTAAGWRDLLTGAIPQSYPSGSLPYSFDLAAKEPGDWASGWTLRRENASGQPYPDASTFIDRALTHPVEERFFRQRLGAAMLEWADALYRSDAPSSIARARELYKGVLYLFGEKPPTAPTWGDGSSGHAISNPAVFDFLSDIGERNPAVASQLSRARLGFYQIEAGLNYYGYPQDLVPTLRYRTLKDAADHYAALAKGAQQDWLAFMSRLDDAGRESITATNMIKRAQIQSEINHDQALDAEHAIDLANQRVAAVQQAIEDKKKEIDDHDSFWGQVSDFASGFVDTFTSHKPDVNWDTPTDATGASTSEATANAAEQSGWVDAQQSSALAAGGSIMLGYAAFYYASYKSLSGMADAANQRRSDLDTLRDKTLPAAQEEVVVKQRGLDVVHLQGALIQSDVDFAHDIIEYQRTRALSIEFLTQVASVMQRVLRRYLDLGARTAWLAERALAYEQDRNLQLIRLDYYPTQLFGYTGADLLQADLTELEAARLAGLRETMPVKHTFSLVRDFPLQFGQLRKYGKCVLRTDEAALSAAYPGTYGYRIRAVTAQAVSAITQPTLRGLLTNHGVSRISRSNGKSHVSVRPADALALSEFRLRDDMAVYGLPDESLFAFEGSGIDTFWTIEFPDAANPGGMRGLADVLITVDTRASYSPDLYRAQMERPPSPISRIAYMSADHDLPNTLRALRNGDATVVSFAFDFGALDVVNATISPRLTNLALMLAARDTPARVVASLQVGAGPTAPLPVIFENGVAFSNIPPIVSPDFPPSTAPSPLNALAGSAANQVFKLTFDAAANAGVDFKGIQDIVIAVDFTATATARGLSKMPPGHHTIDR